MISSMRCPVLVLVVLLSIMQLDLSPGVARCQSVAPTQDDSQQTIFGSTLDPNDPDMGSGEPESSHNTTVFPLVDESDTLVVRDADMSPCLLATLNATMQVSYRVPEGIVHETYIALAEIQLPENVKSGGVCGENSTRLLLTWGHNDTFHVNITFTRHEPVTETANATWSLTGLAVSYDLSNKEVFPGSSETETVTVKRNQLSLFTTPVGFTHECSLPVKVVVGTNDRGVLVVFHDVKIAAFGVSSSEFPPDVTVCTREEESRVQEEIVIPLIVACCLCAVVIIIVIAYVISRKIQTTRDQSQYKEMP